MSPGTDKRDEVSESRRCSRSPARDGWSLKKGHRYRTDRRKWALTWFRCLKRLAAVLAPIGPRTTQAIGIAPAGLRALGSRKRGVPCAMLVVDHMKKRDGDEYKERGSQRKEQEEARRVARKCEARNHGVKEGAESEGSQRKSRCRPAVCRPIEGGCHGQWCPRPGVGCLPILRAA